MTDLQHGRWCYVNHGCARPECRAAWSRYQKLWKHYGPAQENVPAIGSERRLQALACMGYGKTSLAQALHMTEPAVINIQRGRRSVVRKKTAERISALYDQLSMKPAKPSRWTTAAVRAAAAKGWLPPLVWNDDEIDNPEARPHGLNREQYLHYRRSSHETRSRVVA